MPFRQFLKLPAVPPHSPQNPKTLPVTAPFPVGDALVVRRETILDTRSQSDRRARADADNLQACLNPIPLSVVEEQLSCCFRAANPKCSVLSSLRSGDGIKTGHEAAATVLEQLADSTEQAARTSALV